MQRSFPLHPHRATVLRINVEGGDIDKGKRKHDLRPICVIEPLRGRKKRQGGKAVFCYIVRNRLRIQTLLRSKTDTLGSVWTLLLICPKIVGQLKIQMIFC